MKILIAYDGSPSADAAIEDLPRAGMPSEADALVACVEDGHLGRKDSGGPWKSQVAEAEALAERAKEKIRSLFPEWTISSEALFGPPAKVILDVAERWQPALLIAGSHGRSPAVRLFLGSVSLELVHKATCSVRVVRAGQPGRTGPVRIVIGNDGSPEAEAMIRAIASRSWAPDTEAQIVCAVQTLVPAMNKNASGCRRWRRIQQNSWNGQESLSPPTSSTAILAKYCWQSRNLPRPMPFSLAPEVWAAWNGFCSVVSPATSLRTQLAPWKWCVRVS
jgi:nucleotide-binding universal stress UspA family protein